MEVQTLRDDFPCLTCGMCQHFKVNADLKQIDSMCKRLDHKHLKFAVPCFKSYDCGQFAANICSDFTPAPWIKQLFDRWTNIYDYLGDWYPDRYEKTWPNKLVYFVIDDDTGVRWGVSRMDFFHNQFRNGDGSLKWRAKQYVKQNRDGFGYKLITEFNPAYKGEN